MSEYCENCRILQSKVDELKAAEDVAIWGEYTQGTIIDLQATITDQAKVITRLADPVPMSETGIDPLTSAVEAKARIAYARAALKEKEL